jgi:hypothetical protein
MPDFTVQPGETITINVRGAAAAGAPANNNANYPNAAANGASVASNNSQFGGVYRRNRNRKTNRRNRKNKTNRRNRKN